MHLVLSAGKSNKGAKRKYSSHTIPYPRNCKRNGYRPLAKRFVGSFGWISVSHDWLMVALRTITNRNQSLSTQTIPQTVSPKACTHSPYSFCSGEWRRFICLVQAICWVISTMTKGWTIRKVRGVGVLGVLGGLLLCT